MLLLHSTKLFIRATKIKVIFKFTSLKEFVTAAAVFFVALAG